MDNEKEEKKLVFRWRENEVSIKLKLSDLNLGFVNSVRKMYGFY